ncbi:MAG: hypothetical protein MUF70_07140 [Myxococcota bacterium]|nr:hypothetical protein [Myxococcota bacterium]
MPARRGIAFALVLATALAVGVRTASAEPGPSGARPLGAQVGIEWAVGTRDGESQKLELRIEPELDLALPGNFRLKGIGRLRADAFDELEPGPPDQPEVAPYTRRLGFGDRIDAELRELFVQGRVGPAWLRIGKQQIVWGQADGLKLLDVVNPQNFDEFILPVFEDSRIPLWTLDVEVPIDDAQLQLFWIPDPTTHDIPPLDGRFAFTAPRLVGEWPPPGVALRIEDVDRPDDPLRDSDVGARLAGFWKGWDLTANALWHYDDILIPFRTIDLASGAPQIRVAPGLTGGALAVLLQEIAPQVQAQRKFSICFALPGYRPTGAGFCQALQCMLRSSFPAGEIPGTQPLPGQQQTAQGKLRVGVFTARRLDSDWPVDFGGLQEGLQGG